MHSPVWFWQRIVSPHMANLASALADRGVDVTYVAEQSMSADRAAQGWQPPDLGAASLIYAPNAKTMADVVGSSSPNSVHICQGLRGNGLVAKAQAALAREGRQQWVIMETINDAGWRGFIRRSMYRGLIARRKQAISGFLAIGHETPSWLVDRGVHRSKIYPFAYFLSDAIQCRSVLPRKDGPFRVLFVGRIIELKRLDLLIRALAVLGQDNIELHVIGSGPLEVPLRRMGSDALGPRLHWIGQLPSTEVPSHMAAADLLVLPSRYDGWGAVVSESIMAGTPAVCGDRCGSAGVVRASGQGGVFRSGDLDDLSRLLHRLIDEGPQTADRRMALARWGRRLGARAGADYLMTILASKNVDRAPPPPPWTLTKSAA